MVIPRQRELGLCVLLVNVLPLGSFRRWPRCLLVSGFFPRRQRTQGLLNFIEIRVRNNLRDYLHPLKKPCIIPSARGKDGVNPLSLLVTLSFPLGIPALIPAANKKILLAIYKNPSLIKLKMPGY